MLNAPRASDDRETQLRQACAELTRRRRAGEDCRAEELFAIYPALADEVETALDLVYTEYVLRREQDRHALENEFTARFPQWSALLAEQFQFHEWLGEAATDDNLATPRVASSAETATHELDHPAASEAERYEILDVIARGGMGVVYKARQHGLNRLVALKMIQTTAAATAEEKSRFRREAEAAARLQHPNIVPVYEVGERNGQPFFSLEYVTGGNLSQRLAGTPQSAFKSAALVETLARAVHHAHLNGIVHRDLKPANVVLTDAGVPKITDFGLAKYLEAGATQTSSGEVLGTPSYMAPEQIGGRSRTVGPATDVYALGAILYEMLTGRPPLRGENALETLQQVENVEPVPPARLQPRVPRDLDTICRKCLEKEPRRRYASALELADDLRHFQAGEPIRARPSGLWTHGRKWVRRRPTQATLLVVSVAAVLSLLAGGLWSAEQQRQRANEAEHQTRIIRHVQYAAEVRAAYDAHARSNFEYARELLDRQRPGPGERDLRGFEWHYLQAVCQRDRVLRGHTGAATVAAISPAGTTLATGADDNTVRLWNTHDWTERRVLRGHEKPVWAAAFSPDGTTLASGDTDGVVIFWDVKTEQARVRTRMPGGVIGGIVFTPDGNGVVVASAGLVLFLDARRGEQREVINVFGKQPRKMIWTIALSHSGRTLAIGSSEGRVRLWDMAAHRLHATRIDTPADVHTVAFSPDDRTLVSGGPDQTLRFWSSDKGQLLATVPVPRGPIYAARFSPDGQTLAIGCWEETILCDVATHQSRATLRGHTARVNGVVFTPDGNTLATVGDDKAVRLWNPRDGQPLRTGAPTTTQLDHPAFVECVVFSEDGTELITTCDDGLIRVWDVATGQPRQVLRGHKLSVRTLAVVPGGARLISGGIDRTVRIWDLVSGRQLAVLTGHRWAIWSVAVSSDGRTAASVAGGAGKSSEVKLWDLTTGREQATLHGHTDYVRGVAFSPDGRTLATTSGDQTIKLWDVDVGQERMTLRGHQSDVLAVRFAPDGQTLASAGAGGTIRLWNPITGDERGVLRGHSSAIYSLAFSADGRRLASASRDRTVRLWDLLIGRQVAVLEEHTQRINTVAFSPDGQTLATGSVDKTARLWHARVSEHPER